MIVVACLSVVVSVASAQQDRFALKAANGVVFSEFKGYEGWQETAPSQTDDRRLEEFDDHGCTSFVLAILQRVLVVQRSPP